MIYIPAHFNEPDVQGMQRLMQRAPFATLISAVHNDVQVTHLPLLIDSNRGDRGVLTGHMARANPHWQCLRDVPMGTHLAIFHGPHRYITPSWYDVHPSVPTWNYAVVHARGSCQLIDDPDALLRLTAAMTERFERENGTHWRAPEDPDYLHKMAGHIVGFELTILELQGKFKLSQNRTPQDRHQVISALEQSASPGDAELIELMRSRSGFVS